MIKLIDVLYWDKNLDAQTRMELLTLKTELEQI